MTLSLRKSCCCLAFSAGCLLRAMCLPGTHVVWVLPEILRDHKNTSIIIRFQSDGSLLQRDDLAHKHTSICTGSVTDLDQPRNCRRRRLDPFSRLDPTQIPKLLFNGHDLTCGDTCACPRHLVDLARIIFPRLDPNHIRTPKIPRVLEGNWHQKIP